jgi:hypothetical protein
MMLFYDVLYCPAIQWGPEWRELAVAGMQS